MGGLVKYSTFYENSKFFEVRVIDNINNITLLNFDKLLYVGLPLKSCLNDFYFLLFWNRSQSDEICLAQAFLLI
jgi:hypothetical protein